MTDPADPAPETTAPSEATFRRRQTGLAVGIVVLGVLGLVVLALVGRSLVVRLEGAKEKDRATALIEQADVAVVAADTVIRAQVTPALAEQASAARSGVGEANDALSDALALLDRANPKLNEDEQRQSALLRKTAEARQAMLAEAPTILDAYSAAGKAMPLATSGWDRLLSAATKSEQAVAAYNKLTREGVLESQRINKEVAGDLANARADFVAADAAFTSAGFADYIAYADARIALNTLSQRSDEAWLKGDLGAANKLISEYNAADKKAVALAKLLPSTPEQGIDAAYKAAAGAALGRYYKARAAATKADKELRDF
jgi:hypothetical protein